MKTVIISHCARKLNASLGLAFISAIVGLAGPSVAGAASTCCTSGADCAQMFATARKSCKAGEVSLADTCEAMKALTEHEWLLNNPNLSPLTSKEKDIAGTYQVSVGNRFTMTNRWRTTDAPGIRADGESDIKLKRICFSTRDLVIDGSVRVFLSSIPFQLSFGTDLRSVQGQKGYFAEGGAREDRAEYFFTPVASDRTPIELP